ncbi:EamA family transporter [Patescibacteria group bacterium]|nr:EamA family transporter [Patescibacteria group bacterium]
MWFWYAMVSALSSAVSVTINKKALYKINAALVSWALFVIPIPFLLYPSFKNGMPKLNLLFWLAALGSAVLFGYAKTLALRSLKTSLMSEIVPLTFFSVIFQYIFGMILFNQMLKTIPMIGLGLIIVGGYLLKVEEAKENFWRPFQLLFTNKDAFLYLLANLIMVLSTVCDKAALNNMYPVNQPLYLLVGNVMIAVMIWIYMMKKDKNWLADLGKHLPILTAGGIAYTGVSLAYLFGITTGALALVSGVKKFEVIFILFLGWLLFKDKPKRSVWLGSFIMLIGVIMTKLV